MSFKGVRFPVVLVTLALTLVLLFGGRWLYLSQALDRPLVEAVRGVPGVGDVAVSQRQDTVLVTVKVGDTLRLESLVADLWRVIEPVEGDQRVELAISDSRSQALQDVYDEFHFFLQEAVATSRYSDLPGRLAQVATAAEVQRYRLFVASDYVYLQLHQGDACLYEIVPRRPAGSAPSVSDAAAAHTVTVRPWGS